MAAMNFMISPLITLRHFNLIFLKKEVILFPSGLENLDGLEHLRLLRVAGCKYMDDWCVSRIGALMPTLTMLDLSGCTRITANGQLFTIIPRVDVKKASSQALDEPDPRHVCIR